MRVIILVLIASLAVASCAIIKSTQVEQAVVKALAADQRTAGYSFEVSLESAGRVLITGEVDTAQQVEAVREIALTVSGVESVINKVHMAEPGGSGLMQDEVVNTPYF